LRSIITDDSGDGVLYLHPPSSAAGWQVWFAGLDMASGVITNGATIVIQ